MVRRTEKGDWLPPSRSITNQTGSASRLKIKRRGTTSESEPGEMGLPGAASQVHVLDGNTLHQHATLVNLPCRSRAISMCSNATRNEN